MTAVKLAWGPASVARSHPVYNATTSSTVSLNDSNNAAANRFIVPKAGIIDRVGFYVSARVGTPPAYNVALVTIVGTTAPTSTTPFGGSAVESYTVLSTGLKWVTLSTPATVARGDILYAKIWPGAVNPDGSNYVTLTGFDAIEASKLFNMYMFVAAWAGGYGTIMGVKYQAPDNETILPGISAGPSSQYHINSNPDEYGAAFTVPFDCTCDGAIFAVYAFSTSTDFEIRLYSPADVLLGKTVFDTSFVGAGSCLRAARWAPVSLTKNTTYRLSVLPLGGTPFVVSVPNMTIADAYDKEWFAEGARWQGTTRVNAGAWTDNPNVVPSMAILLNDIDFGGTPPQPTTSLLSSPLIPLRAHVLNTNISPSVGKAIVL